MPRDRGTAALLFLLVWLSVAWFGSWEWNPNTATRMFAAISLVEDGDATIDAFAPLTIDKAVFGDHVYMDKAPGMTLMALPAVAVANAGTGERSAGWPKWFGAPELGQFLRLRTRLAVASGPALLTALAAVLLFDWGAALTGSRAAGLFGALGYALGTPIWGWSATLFGHAPVAALFVIAAWCLWRATEGGRRRLALAGGVALGWAVAIEYQAVLAGSAIAAWAVRRAWRREDRWRLLIPAAIGGIAALLPVAVYNIVAFGTVLRVGYSGVQGFEGMRQGLFGLGWPSPRVLIELLIGDRRGLFWVAPVLLVAPLGLAALADRRETRGVAAMAAGVTLIVLLVNAAYVYWDGGNAIGPRHAMPMIGLLALGLAPWWAELRTPGRIAAALLLAGSAAINWAIAAADVFAPPEYRWPWWTYVMRVRFLPGELHGWPTEWLGWSPWAGFALYLAVALPLLGALVLRVRRVS